MCTIPPPPPPPPASELTETVKPSRVYNDMCKNSQPFNDVCKWALHELDLFEACASSQLCLHKPPFKYKYRNFKPIIQIGPTCGLVALSMMLNGEVEPNDLLEITKLVGYSCNGEMLSCKDMMKLAEKAIRLIEAESISCELRQGGLYTEEIVQELLDGALLLVPYDADFNHYPCERHGHTAHWALVSGVLIVDDLGTEAYTSNQDNVYVLCRHGKSRFLSAWLLRDLDKSNKNLWEFSPKKMDDDLQYVIPDGGIGGENGLREQFLLFKGF